MALWRVHVELEDIPGRLGELATAVGVAGCNIISLHVVGEPADDGAVTDELLVRVPDGINPADLVTAVEQAGIPCTLLVRADVTELSDPATTALALARMVVADPGSAPRAVATMLRARLVEPDAPGTTDPPHVHGLRVGAHQLRLGRAWPFTATELSRAAALLDLAAQIELRGATRSPEERTMLLPDGSEVRLRPGAASDAPLVGALHAVCSPQTRRSRFLSPTSRLTPDELALLVGGDGGVAVLALTSDGGSAVALANIERETDCVARVAVLVADAWQGRGLGTALLRMAAEYATDQGIAEITAAARTEDVGITKVFRRAGLRPSAEIVDGIVLLRASLAVPSTVL